MYRTTSGTVAVKRTILAKDLTGSVGNLKWAIGGISLHLNQTLTKAQYDNLIAEEIVNVGGSTDKRPRTMIGYIPSEQQIVLAIAVDYNNRNNKDYGITFYDARTIMSGLGCTMGIHLDGGSSTSIRLLDQEDFTQFTIRHKVTDAAQLTTAYFDTQYGAALTRIPSQWDDIEP